MLQCFFLVLIIIPHIWRTLFPEVESLSALEQEETEFLTWEEMCSGTIEILLGVILIRVSLHSTPWGFVSLSGMGLVSPCMIAFYIKCDQRYTTCGPNGESWHRLNWHNCGTQSLCASVGAHQACIAYIYTFRSHFFPTLFPFLSLSDSLFIPPYSLPIGVYSLCQSGFILWDPAWCSDVLSPSGQSLHVVNRL